MTYNNSIANKQTSQDLGYVSTPKEIALEMAHKLLDEDIAKGKLPDDFALLDPCCGTGNLTKACIEILTDANIKFNLDQFYLFDAFEDNIKHIAEDSELQGVNLALADVLNDETIWDTDCLLWIKWDEENGYGKLPTWWDRWKELKKKMSKEEKTKNCDKPKNLEYEFGFKLSL